jgi:hypothetical protein
VAEDTGMTQYTRMASGMIEPTGMAEDTAEMAESSEMPSGMAEAIGIPEDTKMIEAIVTTRAC